MLYRPMVELSERVKTSLATQEQYLNLHLNILVRAGGSLAAALARGNKLIALGCPTVAQHIVAELTGRFIQERPGLPAIFLGDNPASVTSILNDYGRNRVYIRQLMALAQAGDFVLGFMAGLDHVAHDGIDHAQREGLETLVLEVPGVEEWMATELFLTAAHLLCEEVEVQLQRLQPDWFAAAQT
jgi:D-sedoheptulose 7-phosphate isomerase